MKEIHDKIFNHLRSQYPDLTFVLRKSKKYGRLDRGYWFMGNETYLCVSFWDIRDNLHFTPKIYLSIEPDNGLDGRILLVLVDRDSLKDGNDKRSSFLKKIAPALKITQKKEKEAGLERLIWIKEYSTKDYIKAIDDFISSERIIIDSFIASENVSGLFPPVQQGDFDKALKKIEEIKITLKKENQNIDNTIESEVVNSYVHLSELNLSNIGHFESLTLSFDKKKQVTVIYGENGTGKSTILQTIALGLTGLKNESVINERNDELRNLLRIDGIEKNIPKYCNKGSIELQYRVDNKSYKNVLEFSRIKEYVNDDGNLVESYTDITDELCDYKNFQKDNNKFINLIKSFSQTKSGNYKSDNDKNGKSEEWNSEFPVLQDSTPLIYQNSDNSFEHFNTWILEAIDPKKPISYKAIEPALIVALEVIRKVTEGAFDFMPLSSNQTELYVRTPDAPNGIPLWLISDGYRNVIGWVGDFIKRLYQTTPEDKKSEFEKSYAICLIDEIDTYLHPKWQRTILKTLADTFRNTHFVVTTHSPLVITSLKSGDATIYHVTRNNEGKIDVLDLLKDEKFIAYGSTVTYFLKKAMDIQSDRPEIDVLLRKYRRAIEKATKESLEQAEKIENEIELLINEDDPELSRLRTKKEVEEQWLNRIEK